MTITIILMMYMETVLTMITDDIDNDSHDENDNHANNNDDDNDNDDNDNDNNKSESRPPVVLDDGSTARTATACPLVVRHCPSVSIIVLLPAPGGPEMPANKMRISIMKKVHCFSYLQVPTSSLMK
jgi:hypothetical protein